MITRDANGDGDLNGYLNVLSRYKFLIASVAAIGLIVSVLAALLLPLTYTASSTVYVNVTGAPLSTGADFDGTGQAQIAQSYQVALVAAKELGVEPETVMSASSASLIADSQVITVSYEAGSSPAAVAGANAVAKAYLDISGAQNQSRLKAQLDAMDAQLAGLQAQLKAVDAALAAAQPDSAAARTAASQRDDLQTQYGALAAQRNTMARVDTTAGQVLTPALPSSVSSGPSRGLVVASGLAAGLLLGVLTAFVLHGWADRRRPDAGSPTAASTATTIATTRSTRTKGSKSARNTQVSAK